MIWVGAGRQNGGGRYGWSGGRENGETETLYLSGLDMGVTKDDVMSLLEGPCNRGLRDVRLLTGGSNGMRQAFVEYTGVREAVESKRVLRTCRLPGFAARLRVDFAKSSHRRR